MSLCSLKIIKFVDADFVADAQCRLAALYLLLQCQLRLLLDQFSLYVRVVGVLYSSECSIDADTIHLLYSCLLDDSSFVSVVNS